LPARKLARKQVPGVTTLDRYIFRNVLLSSLAAIGVCAFVLLVGIVVKDLLKAVAAEQIDLPTFASLTLKLVPYVVSYALPMGILTGILLVLGRLSAQQEITAMRAAGWGMGRIAVPILCLAVLGASTSLWFNCRLGPQAMSGYRLALADAVRTNPLSFIVPQEFVRTFPGYVIHVAEKDGTRVRGLSIWNLDEKNRVKGYLRAETGLVEFDDEKAELLITPYRGVLEVRDSAAPEDFTKDLRLIQFAEWRRIPLPLDTLIGKNTFRRKLSLLTLDELRAELAKVLANPDNHTPAAVQIEASPIRYLIQKQFSLAVAVLAFAVVGVPLGIKMQRKESSANLGLALVLALGFYFLMIMIDWLQKKPELRPDILLWSPNVLFVGLGLWLFWRVDRQ
jgi:lipopolysaccharide export system permease protein